MRIRLLTAGLALLSMSALANAEVDPKTDRTFKANCQSCHGTTGTPNAGMAKMMGIKAAAEYKDSAADMEAAVKNGKGKMKAFSGKLTDAQIKDAVAYFRTLK